MVKQGDSQAAVTKQDIGLPMEIIGGQFQIQLTSSIDGIASRMRSIAEEPKDEIVQSGQRTQILILELHRDVLRMRLAFREAEKSRNTLTRTV